MEHKIRTSKRGLNHLAFGSVLFGWGILLLLKQAGILEKTVSTWPFVLTAFGALFVVAGVIKLRRSRHDEGFGETE